MTISIDCGSVGVAGYYSFYRNGELVYEEPSKNLITDYGWDRLVNVGEASASATTLQLGTSNTPPTVGDTALGGFLVQKVGNGALTNGTGTDTNGNYSFTRLSYVFAQGAVVGNVAEVGWKVASGDSGLTSRSLVKDGNGNPAVIVVTAIDQLTVTYELRYHRAAVDVSGTVMVAGVSTTYVFRTAAPTVGTSEASIVIGGFTPSLVQVRHYGAATVLGAPGTDPIGTSISAIDQSAMVNRVMSSNNTSATLTFTTPVCGTGSGNASGGVGCIILTVYGPTNRLGVYGTLKASFTPPIPKDSTKTLAYSFSMTINRF